MPISWNAINYFVGIRGWQYVTLSGSLTFRIVDDNIFFDACRLSISSVVNRYADIVFRLCKLLWIARSPLIVTTRSHVKVGVTSWRERREKRRLRSRKTFMDRAKTFKRACLASFSHAPICILRVDNGSPFVSDCTQTAALSVIACSS